MGDLCDNCPTDPNTDQADGDGDGLGDACDDPALLSAVSRKAHGAAGDLDLPLEAGQSAVECRLGGPTLVVLTFSKSIQAVDGTPDATEVSLSAGTLQSVSIADQQMTIGLTDVPDASCLTMAVGGLSDLDGRPLTGDSDLDIRVLFGDRTGDGVVNIVDLQSVKHQLSRPVTTDNSRCDVDADGVINIVDLDGIKRSLFHQASCP